MRENLTLESLFKSRRIQLPTHTVTILTSANVLPNLAEGETRGASCALGEGLKEALLWGWDWPNCASKQALRPGMEKECLPSQSCQCPVPPEGTCHPFAVNGAAV